MMLHTNWASALCVCALLASCGPASSPAPDEAPDPVTAEFLLPPATQYQPAKDNTFLHRSPNSGPSSALNINAIFYGSSEGSEEPNAVYTDLDRAIYLHSSRWDDSAEPVTTIWRLNSELIAQPLISIDGSAQAPYFLSDDSFIIVEERQGQSLFRRVRSGDGEVLGSFSLPGSCEIRNCGLDGRLYIRSSGSGFAQSLLVCSTEGELLWETELQRGYFHGPSVTAGGVVYIFEEGLDDAPRLLGLSSAGVLNWSVELRGDPAGRPIVTPAGNIYIALQRTGPAGLSKEVRCFSPLGTELWVAELQDGEMTEGAVMSDGSLVIADSVSDAVQLPGGGDGGDGGEADSQQPLLYCISQQGQLSWYAVIGKEADQPLVDAADSVYLHYSTGQLRKLSRDGVQLWDRALGEVLSGGPRLITQQGVLLGVGDGCLVSVAGQ